MKVILLKDIEKLGGKFEVKEVADGYARNFLIPNGLVKLATKENLEWLKTQKIAETQKAEEDLKRVQALVSKIDGLEVVFLVKTTKEDKIFGSVNAAKIADKLQEMDFDIKRSQINLESPIKELGECPVKLSFSHGLEAEITVIIEEEK